MGRPVIAISSPRMTSCTSASNSTGRSLISARPTREKASKSSMSSPISTLASVMVFR